MISDYYSTKIQSSKDLDVAQHKRVLSFNFFISWNNYENNSIKLMIY